jgi:hypothetical protein
MVGQSTSKSTNLTRSQLDVLPRDNHKLVGLIDADGPVADRPVKVERVDDSVWEIEVLDPDDYPAVE